MPPRRKPHVRRTESQWAEILGEFSSSGLGPGDFCAQRKLSLASFQRWRRRLGVGAPAKFVELVRKRSSTASGKSVDSESWSLDVTLPNGVALRFEG